MRNDRDDDEVTGQRCPSCGHGFRVLADEAGQHPCPRCGYFPEDEDEDPVLDDDVDEAPR